MENNGGSITRNRRSLVNLIARLDPSELQLVLYQSIALSMLYQSTFSEIR